VKEGIKDAATAAGIETMYLRMKQGGFPHPPEIAEQYDVSKHVEMPELT
jgi:hypothetical protein